MLLDVQGLQVSYGDSQVLFGVNLALREGEVTALLGRNGMGKSTAIGAVCRLLPSTSARLQFEGRDLAPLASHQAARLGLGLVPEGRRCFAKLSVLENLQVAARSGHWDLPAVYRLFPRLQERLGQLASTLSGGEQQMLAIGRALMTNPKLLLLDEATEGLAPLLRAEIWSAVAELKRETGLAILVVDKSLPELARVADHASVIQRGVTVWSGPFAELSSQVKDQYLGV